jgi:hypothetical protein
MTYACPADAYLLNLQRLQSKDPHTIGNFARYTRDCNLHTAYNPPYGYDYVTKFCRQQTKVMQNNQNEHVLSIGQGEARHRKYKRLKLGGEEA